MKLGIDIKFQGSVQHGAKYIDDAAEPFTKLMVLLNFHLSAPIDIIDQIKMLKESISIPMIEAIKAINSQDTKDGDKHIATALSELSKLHDSVQSVSGKVYIWLVEEKTKLSSTTCPMKSMVHNFFLQP